jgi:hypothetical protein
MFGDMDKTYKSILPRNKGMDIKEAFDAWIRTGSLIKARLYLKNEKEIYNERTGKPFTTFAVRHAACRYMALHHDKAKPILINLWKERENVDISDEEWNKFIVETARDYISSSRSRFMRWLEDNPWALQYDYIYAEKYGLTPKYRPKV